jgi:hypothetical protein
MSRLVYDIEEYSHINAHLAKREPLCLPCWTAIVG